MKGINNRQNKMLVVRPKGPIFKHLPVKISKRKNRIDRRTG